MDWLQPSLEDWQINSSKNKLKTDKNYKHDGYLMLVAVYSYSTTITRNILTSRFDMSKIYYYTARLFDHVLYYSLLKLHVTRQRILFLKKKKKTILHSQWWTNIYLGYQYLFSFRNDRLFLNKETGLHEVKLLCSSSCCEVERPVENLGYQLMKKEGYN